MFLYYTKLGELIFFFLSLETFGSLFFSIAVLASTRLRLFMGQIRKNWIVLIMRYGVRA